MVSALAAAEGSRLGHNTIALELGCSLLAGLTMLQLDVHPKRHSHFESWTGMTLLLMARVLQRVGRAWPVILNPIPFLTV